MNGGLLHGEHRHGLLHGELSELRRETNSFITLLLFDERDTAISRLIVVIFESFESLQLCIKG